MSILPRRLAKGALLVGVWALHCRRSGSEAPRPTSRSDAAVTSSSGGAAMVPVPQLAVAGCTASPAGGVSVVADGEHVPRAPAIHVGQGGVLVTWLEDGAPARCMGDGRCTPVDGYARVLDPENLSPSTASTAPPIRLANGLDFESSSGFAPVALPNGGLYGATCTAHVVSSKLECALRLLAGPALADATWSFDAHTSALVVGPAAATGAGNAALLVVPVRGEIYLFTSGTPARHELIADVGRGRDLTDFYDGAAWVDAPAIAPAAAGEAIVVWRASPPGDASDMRLTPPNTPGVVSTLRARVVGTDGLPRGHAVILSAPGDDVGAPSVTWIDGAADVVYAHRHGGREPWTLARARWKPGSVPTRTEIVTGGEPAVAAAVVAEPGTGGCALVSWTEGRGRATVAKAGRLCPSSSAVAGAVAFSRAGVEAGKSVLTADGEKVFALWQEIPGHGAPVELRLARLGCPVAPPPEKTRGL